MSATAEMLALESGMRMYRSEHGAAREFMTVARAIGDGLTEADVRRNLQELRGRSLSTSFAKAVVPGVMIDDIWNTNVGRDMTRAFIGSIAQSSVFDLIGQYAQPIPAELPRVLFATGATANTVIEGAPKVVSRVSVALGALPTAKACALMVYSDELAKLTDYKAGELFERELKIAVLRAFNAAALGSFTVTSVAGTGSAVGDLEAGLLAAADSVGYVVAARPEVVRELALASEGRMGVSGGEYIPGVHVVAVESTGSSPQLTVIPASRVALTDLGMFVRNSRHASLMMSDTPESPAQLVNMFQTDSRALLVERQYRMASTENAIEVG